MVALLCDFVFCMNNYNFKPIYASFINVIDCRFISPIHWFLGPPGVGPMNHLGNASLKLCNSHVVSVT